MGDPLPIGDPITVISYLSEYERAARHPDGDPRPLVGEVVAVMDDGVGEHQEEEAGAVEVGLSLYAVQ